MLSRHAYSGPPKIRSGLNLKDLVRVKEQDHWSFDSKAHAEQARANGRAERQRKVAAAFATL